VSGPSSSPKPALVVEFFYRLFLQSYKGHPELLQVTYQNFAVADPKSGFAPFLHEMQTAVARAEDILCIDLFPFVVVDCLVLVFIFIFIFFSFLYWYLVSVSVFGLGSHLALPSLSDQ
jgi:hypothetical protein